VRHEWTPSAIGAGVAASLIAAAIIAGGVALWPESGESRSIVGGCAPFNLYAQNQFEPYGAKRRTDPIPTSEAFSEFAPNEVVTVDGWVRTRPMYPTNNPPWNSDVWYHLANDSGWVPFAAVRAVPTDPGTDGNYAEGSDPAPADLDCQGSIRN
jgi:hypothetical protein